MMMDDDMMPIDTTPVDTMITGIPCDPDVVYFDLQILPILISNCALSGCHDEASAEDGVILVNYETVIATADVEPFNLNDSEIYEVLVDDDEDERMPPAPAAKLNADQINLIAKWILQGGEDLTCDPDIEGCETTDVSFSATLQPVLNTQCVGCHGDAIANVGINLEHYEGVKAIADNGQLVGAINWATSFEAMPQGGAKLSQCVIDQVVSWINDGAPDN